MKNGEVKYITPPSSSWTDYERLSIARDISKDLMVKARNGELNSYTKEMLENSFRRIWIVTGLNTEICELNRRLILGE